MKFVALVLLMSFLIGIVLAQEPVCLLEPLPVGLCDVDFQGYRYSPIRNRCTNFAGTGCTMTGNFFTSRHECEERCKQFNSLREAPFTYFLDRAGERVEDLLSRVSNFPGDTVERVLSGIASNIHL